MKLIIIGNGVCGITVAKFFRTQSEDAEITIFTEENEHYYPKPILIEFLAGRVKHEEVYFYNWAWYTEKKIKVKFGKKVVKINEKLKNIELENGEQYPYDCLVLANGATSTVPAIEGVKKKGSFTLRTIDDAQNILEYLSPLKPASDTDKRKAIILGGGFLGLEIAYAMLGAGLEPIIIEHHASLLSRQIDEQGSDILKIKLESMGIKFKLESECISINGNDQVESVTLKGGEVIPAHIVIIAVGICPNIELAKTASLKVSKGVVVNKFLQTDDEHIYACGDVAEFDNQVYGIIPVAMAQAQTVAFNALNGPKLVYKGVLPSNTLKIAGVDLTCLGDSNPQENAYDVMRRSDPEKGTYIKLLVKANKVGGVILINNRKDILSWTKIINQQIDVGKVKETILSENFDMAQVFQSKT
ncbi:MAG: FAD-dependent oxidoreductase [bacterium]|nr:FAD-dependent oxidoreductase [bacterium]MDD5756406.1 FAD-dependent oxidoreductase [bacterium]